MWTLLIASLVAQPAAEPPADSVAGPPPLIVMAKVEKDQLVSVTTVFVTYNEKVAVKRNVGGTLVTQFMLVPKLVATKVKKAWDLKNAKITDGSGKKIDLDTLRKRLAVESPVVISADGKPIGKGYLNLMRAEVIVIEAPAVEEPIRKLPPQK